METKITFKNWLIVVLLVLIFILLLRGCKMGEEFNLTNSLNATLKDSLTTWVDKEGKNRGKIEVLAANNTDLLLKIESSDSTINHLKQLVKRYEKELSKTGSITVIKTQGKVEGSAPTTVIITDSIKCEPTYESEFNFKGWVYGKVIANKDSVALSVNYKEELDIVIGEEKTGFLGLGKPKHFADVTLHNPYSEVKQLRVFQKIPNKPKRIGIGPVIAYGVGPGFVPGVFVGFGANWTLFRL